MKAEVDRRRRDQQAKKDHDNMMRTQKMQAEQQAVEARQQEIARREQENL